MPIARLQFPLDLKKYEFLPRNSNAQIILFSIQNLDAKESVAGKITILRERVHFI